MQVVHADTPTRMYKNKFRVHTHTHTHTHTHMHTGTDANAARHVCTYISASKVPKHRLAARKLSPEHTVGRYMALLCNNFLSNNKHKLCDGTTSRLPNALACTPGVLDLTLERERSTNMRKPQQIPRHQNLSLPHRLTGPTAQHCSRTGSALQ